MGQEKRGTALPCVRTDFFRHDLDDIAGFTCTKCPQPYRYPRSPAITSPGRKGEPSVIVMPALLGTTRCKNCNRLMNRFRWFRESFDRIRRYTEATDLRPFMATFTSDTSALRGDCPVEVNNAAMAMLRTMKAKVARIMNRGQKWSDACSGGIVCAELKWRRPRDVVRGKDGEIIRVCTSYEAHPHVHFVGLTVEKRLNYVALKDEASNFGVGNVWFDAFSLDRMQRYLRGYLMKDDPRGTNGKTVRSRERLGCLKVAPMTAAPPYVHAALGIDGVRFFKRIERYIIPSE